MSLSQFLQCKLDPEPDPNLTYQFDFRPLRTVGAEISASGLAGHFLYPELIHVDERPRILGFESVPKSEIDHRAILGKLLMVALQNMRCLDEAEKLQLVVGKEAGNLRQVRALLLHVEEKIAEFAQRIEIDEGHNVAQGA